jgi:hypothetical protein
VLAPARSRRAEQALAPVTGQDRVENEAGTAFDTGAVRAACLVPVRAGWLLHLALPVTGRAIEVQHHADLRKGDSSSFVTLARSTDKIS